MVGKQIIIVNHGVPPGALGGVEENIRQHALRLLEMGADIHIIGGTGGGVTHPRIRTKIRPEYADIASQNETTLKKLLRYRDRDETTIPKEFLHLVAKTQRKLRQDLSHAEYVIVHNVHSIPFEGYLAYSTALIRELKRLGESPKAPLKRVVFIGHDMPSPDRPDLIRRLGIRSLDMSERSKVKFPFTIFLNRLHDHSSWKYGYGSISAYQVRNTARLYKIPPHESSKQISYIPTTGVDPQVLHGSPNLQNPVGLSPRVEAVIRRRRIDMADGILFYPARMGVPRKRLDLVVNVLAEIHRIARKKERPFRHIHLIITGPLDPHTPQSTTIEQLHKLITKHRLTDHVTIISEWLPTSLSFEEVASLYRFSGGLYSRKTCQDDSDSPISHSLPGFVFSTSCQEGGGMPQIEAIALGIEVITTDLPPVRENLHDIHSVTYFDVDASATNIADLVLSRFEHRFGIPGNMLLPRTREQFLDSETVVKRFNWQRIVEDLLVPWMLGKKCVVSPNFS